MRVKRVLPKQQSAVFEQIDLNPVREIILKYRNKRGGLIALLQEIQAIYTYLPKPALELIQDELNYSISELYAVATFYAQFKLKPSGKYSIKVCKGTACHVQNANAVMDALGTFLDLKDGETTADGKYTLEAVSCLGCCSLAPAMMIGEETFGKLDGKHAVEIVKKFE